MVKIILFLLALAVIVAITLVVASQVRQMVSAVRGLFTATGKTTDKGKR